MTKLMLALAFAATVAMPAMADEHKAAETVKGYEAATKADVKADVAAAVVSGTEAVVSATEAVAHDAMDHAEDAAHEAEGHDAK